MRDYPAEVNPWTIRWFESLPQAYQTLDAATQNPPMRVWDGFNPLPFDFTTMGGWTVDHDDATGYGVYRQFTSAPGERVHYQVWVTPGAAAGAGGGSLQMVAVDTATNEPLELRGPGTLTNVTVPDVLTGYFYPPVSGEYTVLLVSTHLDDGTGTPIPDTRPWMDAANFSRRQADYTELPRKAASEELTYYPLLRFMDGIGQIGGKYSQLSDDLWDGKFTDPATCRDQDLRWLAQMLGIHRTIYRGLEASELRALIQDTVAQGLSPLGSRSSIEEITKAYLIGDKKVRVGPHPTLEHTIRVKVRIDEIPSKNLAELAARLHATGTMPAGHVIVVEDGVDQAPTWEQFEAAAGGTWQSLEAQAVRWTDLDRLGTPD